MEGVLRELAEAFPVHAEKPAEVEVPPTAGDGRNVDHAGFRDAEVSADASHPQVLQVPHRGDAEDSLEALLRAPGSVILAAAEPSASR